MSETVQITLITFVVGPVVLAFVNWVLGRKQRRTLERIDNQVSNDHVDDPTKTSNLREDIDEKHTAVVRMFRDISQTVRNAVRDIGGLRDDIRQLRRDLSHTDERVDELERTRPKGNIPP